MNAAMLRAAFDNEAHAPGVLSKSGRRFRSLSMSRSGAWAQSWALSGRYTVITFTHSILGPKRWSVFLSRTQERACSTCRSREPQE